MASAIVSLPPGQPVVYQIGQSIVCLNGLSLVFRFIDSAFEALPVIFQLQGQCPFRHVGVIALEDGKIIADGPAATMP